MFFYSLLKLFYLTLKYFLFSKQLKTYILSQVIEIYYTCSKLILDK